TSPGRRPGTLPLAAALLLSWCTAGNVLAQDATGQKGSSTHIAAVTAAVDADFIRANGERTADWPATGLDYAETRYSKLDQIHQDNVGELGLVWSYNLESTRGVEATPVVVDGIMYVSASWSIVHAI